MDTQTKALPLELQITTAKVVKREERALKNSGFGGTIGGLKITSTYINQLIPVVLQKLTEGSRSDSEDFALERVIRQLKPEVIALVCLQGGLHSIAQDETWLHTCLRIGRMLSDECWAAQLTKVNPRRAKRIEEEVTKRNGSVSQRRNAARAIAAKAQVSKKGKAVPGFHMKHWGPKELLRAGHWCANRLLDGLPEVFVRVENSKDRQGQLLVTEGAAELAQRAVDEVIISRPTYQPLETPPQVWNEFRHRVSNDPRVTTESTLLRTSFKDTISALKYAVRTGSMAPALKGLNALQAVPFKINTWIMDLIQEAHERGIHVEGVPDNRPLEEPARLTSDQWAEMDPAAREVRRKELHGIKRANRQRDGELVLFAQDMATARRMAVLDSFYTPMNLDWRGRVYGIPFFNFQRDDRVRAMFLFANGEPIGERGLWWLKVHVANCGDFDKISKRPMEERVKWVDENIELIADYVRRPLLSTDWTKADCPFLFLAACRELVSALAQGTDYVTHMPVSFDGSCSGLQHLAAMTRAPEGTYVNLTDNAEPADVYQLVADKAKLLIEADLDLNVEEASSKEIEEADRVRKLAKLCLDYGVNRSLVKRNVMTYAYSSQVYGMAMQHIEDTMRPIKLKLLKKELSEHPFEDEETAYAAAKYLAKRVHAAIESIVSLPAQAMGFMQALARALAHEGKPLRWTTPAGIPWINSYRPPITQTVKLWLNDKGVRVRTDITVATDRAPEMAKDKCASGVSPNFVHANDAAHLLLTVGACVDEGIIDIATVHDSFGCLPSRADRFNEIIRECFLRMYEDHDVLAELLESARADLTPANHSKLPELPEKGALDLKEILNARYAFA